MSRWIFCVVLAVEACGAAPQPPQHASMFGQADVTFKGDFSKLGDVQSVVVGGIHAYNVRAAANSITVTLQGHATPGIVDVDIVGAAGQMKLPGVLEYDPPVEGVPLKWVSFGASLSQGFESMGLDPHSQTHNFSAQVAKAAGVYLGIPLFTPTFVPPLQPSDMNLDCTQKPNTGVGEQSIFGTITVPGTGDLDLTRARVDPTLVAQNIAIGGETLDQFMHGAPTGAAIIERTVEEPDSPSGDILSPLPFSQLDRLEQLDPDIGICTDLLANDTDSSVTESDDIYPSEITPAATAMPMLQEIAQRIGKLHGQYFIANMPSLTFLPNVVQLRQQRIAAGKDTEASFDAKVQQIDQLTDALNMALAQAVAPYPNIHLVDFHARVESVLMTGVPAGKETLFPVEFGGLLSLDNLHFSDTGYALTANMFIDAINATLHSKIPDVDIAAVYAQDPLSVDVLRADGFTCVPKE